MMLYARPLDPPDEGEPPCPVCGAHYLEPCDEYLHEVDEETEALAGLGVGVVCPECDETYDADGCPCGHVEPDPNPLGVPHAA